MKINDFASFDSGTNDDSSANIAASSDQKLAISAKQKRWHFDRETEEFTGDALYFIREGKDGPIKIGRGNPEARVKTLQIGNPRRLWIMGIVEDSGFTEAFWHAAFIASRMIGEWFRPSPHLLEAIRCALKGADWADEAPPPEGVDPDRFRDEMLESFLWYCDQVWSGESERYSAHHAVSVAYNEAALPLPASVGGR